MNEIIKTIKIVIQDWRTTELILFVITMPFSFVYLALRCIQEMEIKEEIK